MLFIDVANLEIIIGINIDAVIIIADIIADIVAVIRWI